MQCPPKQDEATIFGSIPSQASVIAWFFWNWVYSIHICWHIISDYYKNVLLGQPAREGLYYNFAVQRHTENTFDSTRDFNFSRRPATDECEYRSVSIACYTMVASISRLSRPIPTLIARFKGLPKLSRFVLLHLTQNSFKRLLKPVEKPCQTGPSFSQLCAKRKHIEIDRESRRKQTVGFLAL